MFWPGGSCGVGGWGLGSGAETCLNPAADATEELFVTVSDLTVVLSELVVVVDDSTHAS